ncbi:MAG: alpha/beta hydrolase [Gemmatimonadaceae bacterium]
MTHVLLLVALGTGLVYAGVLLLLWRFQEQVVFQPPGNIAPSPVPARQVRYHASDGVELFGYLVGDCEPRARAVLAFHGNADVSRWFVPWATEVSRRYHVCVMLPEYRGYDGLAGAPTYDASSRDAHAALSYLRDTVGIASGHIAYFGHSLGSAIAVELASAAMPHVLVLQSPFSSARAMGARMFLPGLTAFWSLISRVHFDTVRRVRAAGAPVWVAHGDKDFVIPVAMGREVFAAALHKGELLVVPGAGHNDVPQVGGEAYWSWLGRALAAAPEAATPAARAGTKAAP